jgi:hypothetical protein
MRIVIPGPAAQQASPSPTWRRLAYRYRHAALALLLASSAPVASRGMPDLSPQTYTSPSGDVTVVVDPSDRSGAGSASYRFSRNGEAVMTAEHPFALWQAELTDDGMLAGYAYSEGYTDRRGEAGDFIVAVAHIDGTARVLERVPRIPSRFFHTAAAPRGRGVLVDRASDRFVVRIDEDDLNRRGEQWWPYRLGSGEALPHLSLAPPIEQAIYTLDARPIADTPLSIVHWWHSDYSRDDARPGAVYTVIDGSGAVVWQLALPRDYPGDATHEDRLLQQQFIRGAIRSLGPHRFALRHVAAGEQVHYQALADPAAPSGWHIVENERVAELPAAQAEAQAEQPPVEIQLELLGSHRLGGEPQDKAGIDLAGLRTFAINDSGHFAVIATPGCDDAQSRLLLLDPGGAPQADIDLSRWFDDCRQGWRITGLHDGRWLVAGRGSGENARSTVIAVEADGVNAVLLDGFDIESIRSIAPLDDGIVVLLREDSRYSSETSAVRFALDGRERWRVESRSGDERALFSPEALTAMPSGEVVVLENIGGRLKLFGADGAHRRTIELAAIWGRKPNYPTDITTDHRGGVVLHDFGTDPSVVWMNADDEVTAQFTPRFPDGREFHVGGMHVGVDGRLWTSDGYSLLRLDETGMVDAVIGRTPSPQALGESGSAVIAPNGWMYVADQRNAVVHVFDDGGRPQRVCEPLPTDHQGGAGRVKLTVAERGDVYLERTSSNARTGTGYVQFSPTCEHLGVRRLTLGTVSQQWVAARASSQRWVLGYTRLFLVDENDTFVADIARGADDQWLGHLGPAAVAADGSLAVMSRPAGVGTSGSPVVSLFDADGRPLHALVPPDGFKSWFALAFDEGQLIFPSATSDSSPPTAVVVTDLRGAVRFRFEPPTGRRISQLEVIQRDGRSELWLFDGDRTVDRYLMPARPTAVSQ